MPGSKAVPGIKAKKFMHIQTRGRASNSGFSYPAITHNSDFYNNSRRCASRTGAGAHGAGQHRAQSGQVLRGALAQLQCAQPGFRKLSPEVQAALQPLLRTIESLSEGIREYNQRIEALAQRRYPEVALLKQVKGVGTLIALTFLLTLEDPHRFRKSRDVGCYLGLQPGRRNSGQSEPQMHQQGR